MILIVDNYDSFVHNLARYIREWGFETRVIRSDAGDAESFLNTSPEAVIISPGPKTPNEAGASIEIIRRLSTSVPLLGVCLGHQCLVDACGGSTRRSTEPMHGEASLIRHDGEGIFEGIENPMMAGRYHSLVSDIAPEGPLIACARSDKGELMAVRHRRAPWFGVQFHPESLLTPCGRTLVGNFLNRASKKAAA